MNVPMDYQFQFPKRANEPVGYRAQRQTTDVHAST